MGLRQLLPKDDTAEMIGSHRYSLWPAPLNLLFATRLASLTVALEFGEIPRAFRGTLFFIEY